MKQTNDKEMDLLLSRFARREGTRLRTLRTKRGAESSSTSESGAQHMDADEQNAYAENALSPAARSRYASHLADCESCRRSVTTLVLATGAASVAEKSASDAREVSGKQPWWQSFTSLFSLPVIRYGVPALALLLVISIAFIATRQQRESGLIAENKERAPVSAVANQPQEELSHGEGSSTATTASAPEQSANQNSAANANTTSRNLNTAQDQLEPNNRPVPKSDAPAASADLRAGNEDRNVPATPPLAEGPPPAPTTSDSLSRSEASKKSEVEQPTLARPAERQAATATAAAPAQQNNMDEPPEDVSRVASGVAANAASQRQARAAREMSRGRDMTVDGASGSGSGDENTFVLDDKRKTMSKHAPPRTAAERRRAGARADKDVQSEKETSEADEGGKRSVGGRTFRRQGKAWVDTAYTSSRATVNVSRGSEQYRALVADEPTLRTIAEQLGGEILVVWKGRAYRIH